MPLPPGSQLGPYEILSPIGAGGMGEVYKARDTRLDRFVAIKVLPEHIAKREDLRSRFEREARAVASLNHPNICVLHDIGNQDGVGGYMVMEYLEGETLEACLERGALPLDGALRYAMQISDALDRAHRAGVTHRDIKPGNLILTRDGIKVLDFGLAKSTAKPGPTDATVVKSLTTEGTVLGTPQYMAPEQFEGKEADARSDIWAFGAVLYEMATGRKAFEGKTYSSLVGAILAGDPAPLAIRPLTPPWLEKVVRRCLAKDPEDRWQSMRDIVLEFRDVTAASLAPRPVPPVSKVPPNYWRIATVVSLLALLAITFLYLRRDPPPNASMLTFEITPPEGTALTTTNIRISPDGRKIVFMARSDEGGRPASLWVRKLDSGRSHPLPGTESATSPVWSPDSKSLMFNTAGVLKNIDVAGGSPVSVCECRGQPLAWTRDNLVYLGHRSGPITRVSATGSIPEPFTRLDSSKGETRHASIQFAEDGSHYLYLSYAAPEHTGIYAARVLGGTAKKVPGLTLTSFRYLHGMILFIRGGDVYAQRFNADRLELEGDAFRVRGPAALPTLSASGDGTLVYRLSPPDLSRNALVMSDARGKQLATFKPLQGRWRHFEISPDGKTLVTDTASGAGDLTGIWMIDIARGVAAPLLQDQGSGVPAWSSDGLHVYFVSGNRLGRIASNGGGKSEFLATEFSHHMHASPDGKWLAYERNSGSERIWYMPTDGSGKPAPLSVHPAAEWQPQFSPDSRWISYSSDESGQREVYIQSFPPGKGKWIASRNGGIQSRWRGDGRELYFNQADGQLMAVEVRARGDGIEFGTYRKVAEVAAVSRNSNVFDVTRDGQRFIHYARIGEEKPEPITVVVNWLANLKRTIP